MARAALSEAKIRKLEPDPERRREYPAGGGLYLVIQPSGVRSWAYRYRYRGRQVKLTLNATTLKEAEKQAAIARGRIAKGEDPAGEKRAQRAPQPVIVEADKDSFAAAVEVYLKRHVASHQNARSAAETERLLRTHVLPRWGERRLAEIRKRDVVELLDAIVDAGAPISANRTLSILQCAWKLWVDRDLTETNPVQVMKKPTPEVSRDRVLSDAEMVAILDAADEAEWRYSGIIKLMIATGLRRENIADLTRAEVDLANRQIVKQQKGEILRITPLSTMAMDVIEALPRFAGSDRLFPARGHRGFFSGWSAAKVKLDKACGVKDWHPHDFRRVMGTRMQALGVPVEIVDRCLGHEQTGVRRIYLRHRYLAEMADAFQAWADYLGRLRNPETAPANVVQLRG
jgi:integrase